MKLLSLFITIAGLFLHLSGRATILTKHTMPDSSIVSDNRWRYKESIDKVTLEKMHIALLMSDNKINLSFPYQGGTSASVIVRNLNNANELMFTASNGQFNTQTDGTEIKVKFDEKRIMTFYGDTPSDGSTGTLFIENAKVFLDLMKSSKKMIIQIEFYNNGLQVFEFTCAGFVLPH